MPAVIRPHRKHNEASFFYQLGAGGLTRYLGDKPLVNVMLSGINLG